ncbi:MAG TPA: ribosome silencing factor [Chitinophagales bacterium]|nr:ribosome silencing factor [Chitinophagales bacterium]
MKVIKSIAIPDDSALTVELIVNSIQDKKGKDIISLNLTQIPEAVADYFIICNADSTTHVRTIIDNVEQELSKVDGIYDIHIEGRNNGEWALADIGDIVVHVFQTETREFYQLEDLWNDANIKTYENN